MVCQSSDGTAALMLWHVAASKSKEGTQSVVGDYEAELW